jgi:hypothetical protein
VHIRRDHARIGDIVARLTSASMGEPAWIERFLEWYVQDPGDAFAGQHPLHGVKLAEL